MANLFDLTTGKKRVAIISEDTELIKVDATISENHGSSSKTTEQSIEDGSTITDHVIKGSRTYSLTGLVSDSPIDLAEVAVGNLAGIAGSIFKGPADAIITGVTAKVGSSLISDGKGKPSKSAFEALESIWEDSLPVSIVTGLRTYSNMIMETLVIPRRPEINEALEFTATFRQINIVISETIDVPKEVVAPDAKTAATKIKQGKKAAELASEEIVNKTRGSIAYEAAEWAGWLN